MSEEMRESLGEIVREVWIKWAREQPVIKESWVVPYHQLSEPDKEVDRRIGERLFKEGWIACVKHHHISLNPEVIVQKP